MKKPPLKKPTLNLNNPLGQRARHSEKVRHYVDYETTYTTKHLTPGELARGIVERSCIHRTVFHDQKSAEQFHRELTHTDITSTRIYREGV